MMIPAAIRHDDDEPMKTKVLVYVITHFAKKKVVDNLKGGERVR